MEDKHVVQLQSIKEEKDQLQVLVSKQNSIIEELEKQLVTATVNNSALQKQQHDLMETVHNLLTMIATPGCKCTLRITLCSVPTVFSVKLKILKKKNPRLSEKGTISLTDLIQKMSI